MLTVTMIAGLLFVGIMFVCLCCALFAYIAKDVCDGYRDLFKHARRHPRFGMGAVFSLVTIAAAACGLFRWFSERSNPRDTWFLAVFALTAAIGLVCIVQLVAVDLIENYSRRARPSQRSEFVWEEPPSNDIGDS